MVTVAKLTVENASVEKVFQTKLGWGVRLAEYYTDRNGEEGRSFYTLFFDRQPNVVTGNVVTAEGRHGAKIRMVTPRTGEPYEVVDVTLYDATFLSVAAGRAGVVPQGGAEPAGWNFPPADEQEPF